MTGKFRTFYASYEEWVKHKQRRIASSGEFLAKQLAEDPDVAGEWDAKRWANLVAAKPEFAEQCPWESFDGGNWAHLLCFQPQFAEKCPWTELDGSDWADLLNFQPQFAEKCDWSKLNEDDWEYLLEAQPQFADRKPKKSKSSRTKKAPGKSMKAPSGSGAYVSGEVIASIENGKVVSIRRIENGETVSVRHFTNGRGSAIRQRDLPHGKS